MYNKDNVPYFIGMGALVLIILIFAIFPIEKMNQDTFLKIIIFILFIAAILIGLYRILNKQLGVER